jgi:peptidoglycan-associated lipoprotein
VRFKVFGHTDLVGGQGYNYNLGLRRAKAVVNYLVPRESAPQRLEAVVSYGKSRPLIQTNQPEAQPPHRDRGVGLSWRTIRWC